MLSSKEIYDSYLEMFDKLDKYWDLIKDNDLGGLLGSMSPYLFSGGKPIDSSMYEDWDSICQAQNEISINLRIVKYLLIQEDKLKINLRHAIDYLNSTEANPR